jgi:hypothetical protein
MVHIATAAAAADTPTPTIILHRLDVAVELLPSDDGGLGGIGVVPTDVLAEDEGRGRRCPMGVGASGCRLVEARGGAERGWG